MNDLVQRLSEAQAVEVSLRPEKTLEYFKAAVDRGYVHVMFTKTGTELGVRLDSGASDLSGADWSAGSGSIKVVGALVLNYVKVRCHAELKLDDFSGQGHLEILEEVTPAQLAAERAARAEST